MEVYDSYVVEISALILMGDEGEGDLGDVTLLEGRVVGHVAGEGSDDAVGIEHVVVSLQQYVAVLPFSSCLLRRTLSQVEELYDTKFSFHLYFLFKIKHIREEVATSVLAFTDAKIRHKKNLSQERWDKVEL